MLMWPTRRGIGDGRVVSRQDPVGLNRRKAFPHNGESRVGATWVVGASAWVVLLSVGKLGATFLGLYMNLDVCMPGVWCECTMLAWGGTQLLRRANAFAHGPAVSSYLVPWGSWCSAVLCGLRHCSCPRMSPRMQKGDRWRQQSAPAERRSVAEK